MQELIRTDPDFIAIRRYGYSLAKLEARYPDGAPDHIIATALCMSQEELSEEYQTIIEKLRKTMKVGDDAN